jgi:diguanylate cyclase (GGDEF)-like protein/PAS domain S-box-containing protein
MMIQEALEHLGESAFRVEWVTRLSDALECLDRKNIDAVLLNLPLPGVQGVEALDQVFEAAPNALILVLCTVEDEAIKRRAVQRSALGYFIKTHIDTVWLLHALRYALGRKAAEDALLNSEKRICAMGDAFPLGIFVSDAEGACIYTNAAYQKLSGRTIKQTLGTNRSSAIHSEDRRRVLTEWRKAATGQSAFQMEYRLQRQDGSIVWTRVNGAGLCDGIEPQGCVQTFEDITECKSTEFGLRAAEEALLEGKEHAQDTLNSIGDAVLTTDLQGNLTYLNRVAETMTGWPLEDALGRPLTEVFKIIDSATRQVAQNPAWRAINEDNTVGLTADCVLVRRDGSESAIEDSAAPIRNRDGHLTGVVIVCRDVNQSRAAALKMTHLAQHDFLTDLPNRALLTDRLSQAIGLAHRHRKRVALLFVDLDGFKSINDSLGHAIGDQLLRSVAARLMTCVRGTDTVFRQGGDEFVILLTEIEQPQDAAHVAENIYVAFTVPHQVDEYELRVSLSIGISVYPDDGVNGDIVMRNADTAMFHAKASGRDNYQFFSADMNSRAVRKMELESRLRHALREGELILLYQPKIDLTSGVLTGAEALIRWSSPDRGLVYPQQFLPIAEECGLIVPIGRWVLREACRQVRAWLDAGLRAVPVAVNTSSVEFRHESFLDGVALILKETGLQPGYLELEMTESVLLQETKSSALVLEALKAMEVRLAVDDFGTGYSSLNYLKRFPIDTLKIDQSFVHDITTDAQDTAIVRAVIGMGKSLKQRVIAEGVETREQLVFLRSQQCDEGQGFHFSRPLSAKAFARFLATGGAGPRRQL